MCSLQQVLDFDFTGQFLDVDDILLTDAPISCVLDVPLMRLGYLDKSSIKEHIEPNIKLDLPAWMVEVIKTQQINNNEFIIDFFAELHKTSKTHLHATDSQRVSSDRSTHTRRGCHYSEPAQSFT
jgi:hypothetical protein